MSPACIAALGGGEGEGEGEGEGGDEGWGEHEHGREIGVGSEEHRVESCASFKHAPRAWPASRERAASLPGS